MSTSSTNQVVMPELCCPDVYSMCNKIPSCADFVHVKTSLSETQLTFYIRDKFMSIYTVDAETDALGYALIAKEDLPTSLLNEYAGKFRIWAVANGEYIQFVDANGSKFDAIDFECSSVSPKQANAYIDISK
jgi:hypothetical protein